MRSTLRHPRDRLMSADAGSAAPGTKILHVINRLGQGGAERQLTELVSRSILNHEIHELQRSAQRRREQLQELHRRLRAPDVGLVVAWLDRSQIAVALTAPRAVASIASVRGLPRRQGVAGTWLLRAAIARYDHAVFNSPSSLAAMSRFMPPLRLRHATVIPNGVCVASTKNAGAPISPPRIGFIGRDNPAKGLDVLLAALKEFRRGEIEARLVGPGVPEAVAGIRGLQIAVEAHGQTDDPWGAAGPLAALVVPSRSEGSPNVVIEAFASGVPVIGTTVGGTADLIGTSRGIAVPPEDPASIARAVRRILAAPQEAQARSQAARRYVEEHHSWDAIIGEWERLCLSIGRDDLSCGSR